MTKPKTEPTKPNHAKKVMVRFCDNSDCDGDEDGCAYTECRNPRWKNLDHSMFEYIFERCPRGCK